MPEHSLAVQPLQSLRTFLGQNFKQIKAAIPSNLPGLTPERMCKLALLVASQPRSLLPECAQHSILRSLTDLAAVGLEPGIGPTALAYLVPFKNQGRWEAQPIIGYRGYLALARRSGEFQDVQATVVHARDTFELTLGSDPRVLHKPCLDGDPGEIIGAYCAARLNGGGLQIAYMRKGEIEQIRDQHSKSARSGGGPWSTDFAAMAVKSVIRKAAKHWPLDQSLQDAVALDTVAEDSQVPLQVVQVVAQPAEQRAEELEVERTELEAAQHLAQRLLGGGASTAAPAAADTQGRTAQRTTQQPGPAAPAA